MRVCVCVCVCVCVYVCVCVCGAGFFVKANQAQNSWKRRFFVVRAGMLVFFKDDPAKQPPGVATIPQGAVPLQGCEAAMPMDFARSFSTKPRKGVTGFELKLTHRYMYMYRECLW
jgi:hypothetical protein